MRLLEAIVRRQHNIFFGIRSGEDTRTAQVDPPEEHYRYKFQMHDGLAGACASGDLGHRVSI